MPQLYESRGETQELLTRWDEARAALVSNEKRSPELIPNEKRTPEAHACADSGLCDMQTIQHDKWSAVPSARGTRILQTRPRR
jgi:hypothetical protein